MLYFLFDSKFWEERFQIMLVRAKNMPETCRVWMEKMHENEKVIFLPYLDFYGSLSICMDVIYF